MRVIVSFVGGWGHAAPLLPLASWASRLGHHVSFAGQAALRGRLVQMGYEFDVVGPDTLASTSRPLVPIDRRAERAVMRDHFIADFGRTRAALLDELFDRELPGLVICDEVDVGAIIAAERRGVACVTVNVIAAGLLTDPTVIGGDWEELRRAHGLPPDPGTDRVGGQVMIAPLPRSLRSPHAHVSTAMRFVRPPVIDTTRSQTDDGGARSLVYVTLGTVFPLESGDLLARLVQAMNRLSDADDIDVVIVAGPDIPLDELPPPGRRVSIEAFVAQHELLGRCRAVVCHAGSGTLIDALSLGIPVVALPLGADQPDNADRCGALGVGVVLDAITTTADEIADAGRAVLGAIAFRNAAGELALEASAQPPLGELPELRQLLAGPAS